MIRKVEALSGRLVLVIEDSEITVMTVILRKIVLRNYQCPK